MPNPNKTPRSAITWIMSAIVAWGILLATGDFLANHNPRRPLVTMVCVGLFLGVWLGALAIRKARGGQAKTEDDA